MPVKWIHGLWEQTISVRFGVRYVVLLHDLLNLFMKFRDGCEVRDEGEGEKGSESGCTHVSLETHMKASKSSNDGN